MKKHDMMHADHGDHMAHLRAEHDRHMGLYRHETEHPHQNPQGHMLAGMSAEDFKGEAMDTAYGQASEHGVKSDMGKIHAQFHHCYDDSNSGY